MEITKKQISDDVSSHRMPWVGCYYEYNYEGNGINASTSKFDDLMEICEETEDDTLFIEHPNVTNKKEFVNKIYEYLTKREHKLNE